VKAARSELAALVSCHSFGVAIPTRTVARLFLPEQVTAGELAGDAALLGTIEAGERVCAAWDLGRLLGLSPLASSWVVLDVADEQGTLPVALRAGPCAMVAEVGHEAPLPARIFERRGEAFPSAFARTTRGDALPAQLGLFGLWLEPARLFTREERAASRSAIKRAEREQVRR
jgi:hypothetical protein